MKTKEEILKAAQQNQDTASFKGGVTAGGRDQIKELQGSSVPQMLGNESVQNHLADRASQKFEKRMEHEILRILNGWGQSK